MPPAVLSRNTGMLWYLLYMSFFSGGCCCSMEVFARARHRASHDSHPVITTGLETKMKWCAMRHLLPRISGGFNSVMTTDLLQKKNDP